MEAAHLILETASVLMLGVVLWRLQPRDQARRPKPHHHKEAADFVEKHHANHDADIKAKIAIEKAQQLASRK